jgi:hypothetical protein
MWRFRASYRRRKWRRRWWRVEGGGRGRWYTWRDRIARRSWAGCCRRVEDNNRGLVRNREGFTSCEIG